jgi:hypothetical protein
VADDWRMIEPHLPERVESIIDIGCGMGGIDVYLKRRFPQARLELLDGDGETAFYGYGESQPYSSREACEALLSENGVRVDRWHNVGTTEMLSADLIVSTLAWGFHFPLESYRVRGWCIADLYRSREPARGEVIWRAQYSDRCVFQCA